jgi:hypothetical protein
MSLDVLSKGQHRSLLTIAAKHFRISQAFIRGAAADGIVNVDKVDTHDNGADFFTKALTKEPFYKHRLSNMGPQVCPTSR